MSITAVWAKGRGHSSEKVKSVIRYIPKPRVPWQPSEFRRKNLTKEDLTKMWGQGRYRTGVGNFNSGYSTDKTKVLEDFTVNMIPKAELEKYMPDISLGSKALVTPVSLMSARNGHRVTHDMLHSYDAHIGAVEKPAVVDHDAITPHDPTHVGLNAAALDCRGRIYRWLRRGPFFQEDNYLRRYASAQKEAAPQEVAIFKKVIRLAQKGHLKAACEEYRRVTTAPPVEVYRALIGACIPGAHLADAISIFEDGNYKLFLVARDGEVLHNLMSTAVAAKNRPRVMWVYNVMRGRFYDNTFARAEIDPVWQYRITAKGLQFLLDNGCAEEARTLYKFLEEAKLVDCDAEIRIGLQLREMLAQGKPIGSGTLSIDDTSIQKAAKEIAPTIADAIRDSHEAHEAELHSTPTDRNEDMLQWLKLKYPDVNVTAVMRLARFVGKKDIMANDQEKYITRCVQWLQQLSGACDEAEGRPLTYLRKSKPSTTNTNVRVAWLPERRRQTRLLASEEQFNFYYTKDARFVEETFPYAGESVQSKFLAIQPIHTEVPSAVDFSASAQQLLGEADAPRVLHRSSLKKLPARMSASPATTSQALPAANDTPTLADKKAEAEKVVTETFAKDMF